MKKQKSLKEWLEQNKVFFETLTALALTIASLIISGSANKIANRQRQLEEALSRPVINLFASYDEERNYIKHVSILNSGSPVFDLQIEAIPYLEAIVYSSEKEGDVCLALPVDNEWPKRNTFTEMSGAKTGEIATVRNAPPDNFSIVLTSHIFSRKAINNSSILLASKFFLETLTPKYYLVISYSDVLCEERIEIYDIELQSPSLYSSLVLGDNKSNDIRLLAPDSSDYHIAEKLYEASRSGKRNNSVVYYSYPLYTGNTMMTDEISAEYFNTLMLTLRESYDNDHLVIW